MNPRCGSSRAIAFRGRVISPEAGPLSPTPMPRRVWLKVGHATYACRRGELATLNEQTARGAGRKPGTGIYGPAAVSRRAPTVEEADMNEELYAVYRRTNPGPGGARGGGSDTNSRQTGLRSAEGGPARRRKWIGFSATVVSDKSPWSEMQWRRSQWIRDGYTLVGYAECEDGRLRVRHTPGAGAAGGAAEGQRSCPFTGAQPGPSTCAGSRTRSSTRRKR